MQADREPRGLDVDLRLIFVIVFAACQIATSAYALWRGGVPERSVGSMLFAAALLTTFVPFTMVTTFKSVAWGLVWIDGVLWFLLLAVALLADRFWPLWVCGMQLLALGAHAVRGYDSAIVARAYWLIVSTISYPMMLALVVGTLRHRRRLRAGLPEFAWTYQRIRDGRQQ